MTSKNNQNYLRLNLLSAIIKILTLPLSPFLVGKALDGRPRPQKQLSQPTLGVSEHMEAGRLRGSQSSEGPELVHSTSVNMSSSNSAAMNLDSSRDADTSKPTEHRTRWRERLVVKVGLSFRWDSDLRFLQDE